jgi:hypothetical protein
MAVDRATFSSDVEVDHHREELRVGVVVGADAIPAWVAWILEALRSHPRLTLALVVTADPPPREPTLFSLYERADRRVFPTRPDALAGVDAGPILAGVPRVAVADAAAIHAHRLDVLLRLGGDGHVDDLRTTARYGVWSYRHGCGGPPLFDELARAERTAETVLESLDASGARAIYRSEVTADAVSLQRGRNAAYWTSAPFVIRRLEQLASGRWEPGAEPIQPPAADVAAPTAARTVRCAGRIAGRAARRKLLTAMFQHQWFLGVRPRAGDRLPGDDATPWQLVVPPPDRSYTDPFVVGHGDQTFVFFEVLEHRRAARGQLAVGRLEADGRLADVEPVLPLPHHTSYPYVFRDGGHTFLIPETGAARRVQLFAATSFPFEWEPVATLLEGVDAVDASVIAWGGRYWMWVNIAVPGGRLCVDTFLYSSHRLGGDWRPHPQNPVVSDLRRARPAGRPFVLGDRLIRPSQDCSRRYGASVVFNQVDVLTVDDYRERPIASLEPRWADRPNLAAHTYTFDAGWEATDGLHAFPRVLKRF